jgi:hypothetical protein
MAKRLDNTPSHLVTALAHRLGLAVDAQETPRHRRFRFRWVSHWFVALASASFPSIARLVQ